MNQNLLIWALIFVILFVPAGVNRVVRNAKVKVSDQARRVVLLVFMLSVTGLGVGAVYVLGQGLINGHNLIGLVEVPAWLPLAFYAVIALVSFSSLAEAMRDLKKLKSKR